MPIRLTLLFSFAVLFFPHSLVAQQDASFKEKILLPVGQFLPSGHPLMGHHYTFDKEIEDLYVDSLTNTATIYLKGSKARKAKLVLFDLATDKIRWSMIYNKNEVTFEQYDDVLLRIDGVRGKTARVNLETGADIWEQYYKVLHVNKSNEIAFCYSFSDWEFSAVRALHGIVLNTGESRWWRDVPCETAWRDLYELNDSTVIINSKGLYSIDMKNGKGWVVKIETETTAAIDTPPALYLAPYSRFLPKKFNVAVTGAYSNMAVIDTCVYVASVSTLYCIDHRSGKTIWNTSLRSDFMSSSTLTVSNGNLSLCNSGYATRGNNTIETGKSFISLFDSKRGEQHFWEWVKHRSPMLDFKFDKEKKSVCFLYEDKTAIYSLSDGKPIGAKWIDLNYHHPLLAFLDLEIYQMDTSDFQMYKPLFPSGLVVITSDEKFFVVDKYARDQKTISQDECYWNQLQYKDYNILMTASESVLTNKGGRGLALIGNGMSSFIRDGVLYDFFGNTFSSLSLSNIPFE